MQKTKHTIAILQKCQGKTYFFLNISFQNSWDLHAATEKLRGKQAMRSLLLSVRFLTKETTFIYQLYNLIKSQAQQALIRKLGFMWILITLHQKKKRKKPLKFKIPSPLKCFLNNILSWQRHFFSEQENISWRKNYNQGCQFCFQFIVHTKSTQLG